MPELDAPEETIDRLINEIRQKDYQIAEIQKGLNSAGRDLHKLTPAGAVKRLVLDLASAQNQIDELTREIRRLRGINAYA